MTNTRSSRRYGVLFALAALAGFIIGWARLPATNASWDLLAVVVTQIAFVVLTKDAVSRSDAKFWPAPLMAGTFLVSTLWRYHATLAVCLVALIFWLGLLLASLLRRRRWVLYGAALCALSACTAALLAAPSVRGPSNAHERGAPAVVRL